MVKTARQLERHFKGLANHTRIAILILISESKGITLERHFKGLANHTRIAILILISESKGITLDSMAQKLDCNIKTISQHTGKLYHAGLINKKYQGTSVLHTLSPYGEKFLKFIKSF